MDRDEIAVPLTLADQARMAWSACQIMRQTVYPDAATQAMTQLDRLSNLSQYRAIRLFCKQQLMHEILACGGFAHAATPVSVA